MFSCCDRWDAQPAVVVNTASLSEEFIGNVVFKTCVCLPDGCYLIVLSQDTNLCYHNSVLKVTKSDYTLWVSTRNNPANSHQALMLKPNTGSSFNKIWQLNGSFEIDLFSTWCFIPGWMESSRTDVKYKISVLTLIRLAAIYSQLSSRSSDQILPALKFAIKVVSATIQWMWSKKKINILRLLHYLLKLIAKFKLKFSSSLNITVGHIQETSSNQ